jgi:hypothetical protein
MLARFTLPVDPRDPRGTAAIAALDPANIGSSDQVGVDEVIEDNAICCDA